MKMQPKLIKRQQKSVKERVTEKKRGGREAALVVVRRREYWQEGLVVCSKCKCEVGGGVYYLRVSGCIYT
jgi:hypothetical protein